MKPRAKSQGVIGSDKSAIQGRLEFHPKVMHQPLPPVEDEDDPASSEKDREILRTLEESLQTMKDKVEQLTRQLKQEEDNLSQTRSMFQKEQDDLKEQIQHVEKELEDLQTNINEQMITIQELEQDVDALQVQIEPMGLEIEHLTQEKDQYEQLTERELMGGSCHGNLDTDEIRDLEDAVEEEVTNGMKRQLEKSENVQLIIDIPVVEELQRALKEQDIYIMDLESTLEDGNGNFDFEASLGCSIGVEFTALRNKCNLTKGSNLDKEVMTLPVFFLLVHLCLLSH